MSAQSAVTQPGRMSPSEKLNIAGVGVGGIGFRDLKEVAKHANVVALCDVDFKHAARAFDHWPEAKRYKDYRVMLDRQKDIDAVVVATPDHTHAVIYVGDHGKIVNGQLFPVSLREEYQTPEPSIPSSPGHYLEWIEACKGGPSAGSNFEWAGPLTEVVLMGNVALRPELREPLDRQRLLWDAKAGAFSSLPEANEFLHRPYRAGWTL